MPFRSDGPDAGLPEEVLAILDSEKDPPPRELVREFGAVLDELQARYREDRRLIYVTIAGAWQDLASHERPQGALSVARGLLEASSRDGHQPFASLAVSYVRALLEGLEPV